MNDFVITRTREMACDNKCEPIKSVIETLLKMHNLQECENLLNLLTRYDYQKGHIYEDEVRRLQAKIDEMHKAIYAPRMVVKKQHNHNCQQFMGEMNSPKFITQSKDEEI